MREPVSINTVITNDDFKTKLKDIRITNLNRIVISHININSSRNKFELLAEAVMGNVDILMVTERKIDESFPTSQFIIPGFTSPYRFDRTKWRRDTCLYYGRYPFKTSEYFIYSVRH